MQYWNFHERCAEIEGRFGSFRGLRLQALDLDLIRCDQLLDFGAGTSDNSFLCKSYTKFEPDVRCKADLRHVIELAEPKFKSFFDGVYANQVFEHFKNEAELSSAIGFISNTMKSGAKIVATLPNIANWMKYIADFDHKLPLSFYQLGAFFELNEISVIDAYRYTKRPAEISDANQNEQIVLDVLKKFFEIDPAHFVAVVGEKK